MKTKVFLLLCFWPVEMHILAVEKDAGYVEKCGTKSHFPFHCLQFAFLQLQNLLFQDSTKNKKKL